MSATAGLAFVVAWLVNMRRSGDERQREYAQRLLNQLAEAATSDADTGGDDG